MPVPATVGGISFLFDKEVKTDARWKVAEFKSAGFIGVSPGITGTSRCVLDFQKGIAEPGPALGVDDPALDDEPGFQRVCRVREENGKKQPHHKRPLFHHCLLSSKATTWNAA